MYRPVRVSAYCQACPVRRNVAMPISIPGSRSKRASSGPRPFRASMDVKIRCLRSSVLSRQHAEARRWSGAVNSGSGGYRSHKFRRSSGEGNPHQWNLIFGVSEVWRNAEHPLAVGAEAGCIGKVTDFQWKYVPVRPRPATAYKSRTDPCDRIRRQPAYYRWSSPAGSRYSHSK